MQWGHGEFSSRHVQSMNLLLPDHMCERVCACVCFFSTQLPGLIKDCKHSFPEHFPIIWTSTLLLFSCLFLHLNALVHLSAPAGLMIHTVALLQSPDCYSAEGLAHCSPVLSSGSVLVEPQQTEVKFTAFTCITCRKTHPHAGSDGLKSNGSFMLNVKDVYKLRMCSFFSES